MCAVCCLRKLIHSKTPRQCIERVESMVVVCRRHLSLSLFWILKAFVIRSTRPLPPIVPIIDRLLSCLRIAFFFHSVWPLIYRRVYVFIRIDDRSLCAYDYKRTCAQRERSTPLALLFFACHSFLDRILTCTAVSLSNSWLYRFLYIQHGIQYSFSIRKQSIVTISHYRLISSGSWRIPWRRISCQTHGIRWRGWWTYFGRAPRWLLRIIGNGYRFSPSRAIWYHWSP